MLRGKQLDGLLPRRFRALELLLAAGLGLIGIFRHFLLARNGTQQIVCGANVVVDLCVVCVGVYFVWLSAGEWTGMQMCVCVRGWVSA